jgi:hypothetical protein
MELGTQGITGLYSVKMMIIGDEMILYILNIKTQECISWQLIISLVGQSVGSEKYVQFPHRDMKHCGKQWRGFI